METLSDVVGDVGMSVFISLILSYTLLHWVQIHFIKLFEFGFESPHMTSAITSLVLLPPYIAFMTFVLFLSAVDWSH